MATSDPTDLPDPAALSDRRVYARQTLRAEVTVSSQDNVLAAATEDISLGGAFVSTLAPPPIGELVRLELSIDGHARLMLEAEVRWHREDEAGDTVGCGLRFIDLSAQLQARLEELVQSLPQEPLLDAEAW